tara:strand:- start:91 stop:336 length:246 start_codon:yes stop_codon:yes gene_type:complete
MELTLFIIVVIYSIFLNLRIRDIQEEIIELSIDFQEVEIKVYNKMMEIRREIKDSLKQKKIEKPRRRSTKRSSKVSQAKIS